MKDVGVLDISGLRSEVLLSDYASRMLGCDSVMSDTQARLIDLIAMSSNEDEKWKDEDLLEAAQDYLDEVVFRFFLIQAVLVDFQRIGMKSISIKYENGKIILVSGKLECEIIIKDDNNDSHDLEKENIMIISSDLFYYKIGILPKLEKLFGQKKSHHDTKAWMQVAIGHLERNGSIPGLKIQYQTGDNPNLSSTKIGTKLQKKYSDFMERYSK